MWTSLKSARRTISPSLRIGRVFLRVNPSEGRSTKRKKCEKAYATRSWVYSISHPIGEHESRRTFGRDKIHFPPVGQRCSSDCSLKLTAAARHSRERLRSLFADVTYMQNELETITEAQLEIASIG